MKLTFVFATGLEAAGLLAHLNATTKPESEFRFHAGQVQIDVLITGIGAAQTAFSLGMYLAHHQPELIINAGIAGSFRKDLPLGTVVQVVSDCFADLGVEEADGKFLDWADLGWAENLSWTDSRGRIKPPSAKSANFLPVADGVTVQKVTGTTASIAAIQQKYPEATIETMESAAFFMACLQVNRPFLAIRAISNYVEPRNREAWDIPLALKNLQEVLVGIIESFD